MLIHEGAIGLGTVFSAIKKGPEIIDAALLLAKNKKSWLNSFLIILPYGSVESGSLACVFAMIGLTLPTVFAVVALTLSLTFTNE